MRILIRNMVPFDIGQYNVLVTMVSICYNVSNVGMEEEGRCQENVEENRGSFNAYYNAILPSQ